MPTDASRLQCIEQSPHFAIVRQWNIARRAWGSMHAWLMLLALLSATPFGTLPSVPEAIQCVSRMVHAEAHDQSSTYKSGVAWVIASVTRRQNIPYCKAVALQNGTYLSSYAAGLKWPSSYPSRIYFESWAAFLREKRAGHTVEAVRQGLALIEATSIYHFDDCAVPVSWKRKLIEFKVRSGDTMCFYAQGADERAQFMYRLADLREQESTSRAALLDAATDVPAFLLAP